MFESQIITDYINDKISVTIKVEEKPYLENVYIKRVLIENNITIKTNNGALHGGRKKI